MKRIQRFACIFGGMIVMLSASACGKESVIIETSAETVMETQNAETQNTETQNTETQGVEIVNKETADETVETIQETESVVVFEETEVDFSSIDSVEFAANLKLGWNLGNTLDANDKGGLSSETCWGMPTVTKEQLAYVKSQGFTSIRIPVSWAKHCDDNYQIDEAWMARVTEVVDWALEEGFYVIINSHHDATSYYPSDEKRDQGIAYMTAVWTQISDHFKDYDEHLIFESMNEPRLMNTDIEWWFHQTDKEGLRATEIICDYNQVFVDVVRNSGGKNVNRFLMVPGYSANADLAMVSSFSMPEDSTPNHLMLSIHAYTPYDFAMNQNGYTEWTSEKKSELSFMDRVNKKFIKNGYGVVIGEFGVTNKDNSADRVAWAKDYTSKAAKYGIPCFVWDNGQNKVGEENFGLINRRSLELYFPELMDAYLEYYKVVRN